MIEEELPKVFILAAGTSRRFGGNILKQTLSINGEQIIRRTIRQVREYNPGIQIYILTWHDCLKFSDVNIIDTKTRPQELSDTILLSEQHWGKQNRILLGDVVYSDTAIKNILSKKDGIIIFAKDICPAKPASERFALSFPYTEKETVSNLLKRAAFKFREDGRDGHGGMQKICFSTKPDWLLPIIHNTPINPLIRPFRDYFCFHIYKNGWYPSQPIKLVIIDDNITTDIDTPEEYEAFLKLEVV